MYAREYVRACVQFSYAVHDIFYKITNFSIYCKLYKLINVLRYFNLVYVIGIMRSMIHVDLYLNLINKQ